MAIKEYPSGMIPSVSGQSGKYLTTNGSNLSWSAVSTASNFTLLNAGGTALTGATVVTISGISGKNKLFIVINGASSVNAASAFSFRFNTDTTLKYDYVYWSYNGTTLSRGANFGSNNSVDFASITTAAGTATAMISVDGCNSTGYKVGNVVGVGSSGSGSPVSYISNFTYSGTSAISSISIESSSGNLDAGTVYVYGA